MSEIIDKLLSKYEGGGITRRELVATLATLAVAPARAISQGGATPVPIRSLNHVSIEVKDVERSVEFYQRVFGLKVKSREGTRQTGRVSTTSVWVLRTSTRIAC